MAETRAALWAAFGHRVRFRPSSLVREGSAETLSLARIPGAGLDTVAAARALVRRHLPIGAAHRAMTRLFDTGAALVEIPRIEDVDRLRSELNRVGIEVLHHLAARGALPAGADALARPGGSSTTERPPET